MTSGTSKPSDTFVARETLRGKAAIEHGAEAILADPYAVATIYYSMRFTKKALVAHSPQNRIVGSLATGMKNETKKKFLSYLAEQYQSKTSAVSPSSQTLASPLEHYALQWFEHSHPDAIDLFTKEGLPVYSMTDGIVVIAQADWNPLDPFSTVSQKGGNEIIVFDPRHETFYRYCHLATVLVVPGDIVRSRQPIGTVGHTGLNASRKNHGNHLHLEINVYHDEKHSTISLSRNELRKILERIQP